MTFTGTWLVCDLKMNSGLKNAKHFDPIPSALCSVWQLCLVTLSLFHTLVNLNCEDFMLELTKNIKMPDKKFRAWKTT